MIVFAVAFGEIYIKTFFEVTLPSLFSPERPVNIGGEPITLLIATLSNETDLINTYLQKPAAQYFSKNIGAIRVAASDEGRRDLKGWGAIWIAGNLLLQVMKRCIEKDEIFLHAVPDTMYGPGIIETCYNLHRYTGRVVATFNGRVSPKGDAPDFTAEQLLKVNQTPYGVVDFFFENMDKVYRDHFTTDYQHLPGDKPGHLAVQTKDSRFVFTSHPNPFLGKFRDSDLLLFSGKSSFNNWDNAWKDHLEGASRLMVQTNLDAGMMLEIQVRDASTAPRPEQVLYESSIKLLTGPELEARRAFKFGGRTYCFTTSYPPAEADARME